MSAPIDIAQLLTLLESQELTTSTEVKDLILDNLVTSKDCWLVNTLVDFYIQTQSQRSLEILAKVTEPHEKQLLDRITDYLKGGSNKLQGLMLLGHMVRNQPPWMHKIVQHSVLNQVLKIIKTEVDVPILMSAVLLITCLLPLIPVSVSQYLQDIFDGFARLAAFNLKKPGSVPDVYLLHLQVGIYSLFHRLYGMYPCHFLTYLRAVYSKKENAQVFEETIMPMLERVRMHPLLVTATKDKEISRERWKHLDVHDIIVDCAKLSLDMIEGTREDMRCPVVGVQRQSQQLLHRTSQQQITTEVTKRLKDSAYTTLPEVLGIENRSGIKPIVETVDLNSFFSPSALCGITTPPPTVYTTPGGTDLPGSVTMTTPLRTTPHTSVPESPLPSEVELREKGSGSIPQKRLSGLSLSLAGMMPYNSSTGGPTGSVPPSPLKTDFTAEPPFTAYRMQAIRKIDFQQSQASQKLTVAQKADQALAAQVRDQKAVGTKEYTGDVKEERSVAASQKPSLHKQSTLDQPTVSPMDKEQDVSKLTDKQMVTTQPDVADSVDGKKVASSNTSLKVMSKQASLEECKPNSTQAQKDELKRKSWGYESKDRDLGRRSSKEMDSTGQVIKQSSSEDTKSKVSAKFDVDKAHKKLSRKPSGKRQRSSDNQQGQQQENEGGQTQGQSTSQFISPNAREAPIKIPGKKTDYSSDQQSHSVPSVTDLPHFIDSLEVPQEDGDDEVSALTGSQVDSSLSSSTCTDHSDLTAESMQQFMKNVNRIRFNSMNVNTRERAERMEKEKVPKAFRPSSCPDFEKASEEDVIGEEIEDAGLVLSRKSSGESSSKVKWAQDTEIEMVTTHTVTSSVTMVTSSKSTMASQTSFANLKELDTECSDDMECMASEEGLQNYIPYAHMFPMTLPFAPFIQCYQCLNSDTKAGQKVEIKEKQREIPYSITETPFFSTLSPPELLDRHIELGNQTHAKQLTQISLTGKKPTTSVGGLATSDDVNVLRGQLLLLHNQLLYERHKREMYGKRNRRLLGRIVKTTALEEQTAAMRDQLVLQENEIQNYSVTAKLQQNEIKQLKANIDKLEYEKEIAQRNWKEENESLKRSKLDLEDQLQRQKADNDKLLKELQNTKSQLFNTKHELESFKLRADFALELQGQLARLNKELLLMGELQQKYQQRLVSVSSSQNTSAETKFLLESCKEEVKATKQSLEEKTILYDAAKGKVSDLEECVKNKELTVIELKKIIDDQKDLHIGQIQALDTKYKNERKIQQALQGQILTLTAQLHSKDKPTVPSSLDNDEESTSQPVEEMILQEGVQ